jgi:glucose/arabinose dehydrogenase
MLGRLTFLLVLLGASGCGGGASESGGPDGFETRAGGFLAEPIYTHLAVPSALRFTPDGRLFYTELNSGRIRIIQDGALLPTPFAQVPTVADGEQGCLGLAVDPNFESNHYIYVCYTDSNLVKNRVVRFTDSGNIGTNQTTIVDNLPVAITHNGGRIAIGPDNRLYVTIGDNRNANNAQNTAVLPGKVLRFTLAGLPAPGNPISGSPVWAFGLRNPFGLAFRPGTSAPYVSENGPSCDDEINRIVKLGNYGWRASQPCGDTDPNYRRPIKRFNPTIAPTGITFSSTDLYGINGSLLMCSLNDGALRLFGIASTGGIASTKVLFKDLDSGLLDVTEAPDGTIYFCGFSTIYRLKKA